MKAEYEVDEAMLGSEWGGGSPDADELADRLRSFCRVLEEVAAEHGRPMCVRAITGMYNGASVEQPDIPDDLWIEALNRTPRTWWRE